MVNKASSVFEAVRSILSLHSDAFEGLSDSLSVMVRNVTDEVCDQVPEYATARQILDASTAMPWEPADLEIRKINVLEVAFNGAPCGYVVKYEYVPYFGKVGVAGIFFGAVKI